MKFIQVGKNYINLDNVSLVEFNGAEGEKAEATIYFNSTTNKVSVYSSQFPSPPPPPLYRPQHPVDEPQPVSTVLTRMVLKGQDVAAFEQQLKQVM